MRKSDFIGKMIGFFDKTKQLGVGIILDVHSVTAYNRTIRMDVLLGEEVLEDLVVMRMAEDGSLHITNYERLPYAQYLEK